MARPKKPAKTKLPRKSGGGPAARPASPRVRQPASKPKPTVDELVADLVCEGPGDLLTNPRHMEGYGLPNRPVREASPRAADTKSLPELFAGSPLKGLDLKIERDDT